MSTSTITRPYRITAGARVALVLAALLSVLDILVSVGELGTYLVQPIGLIIAGVLTIVAVPFAWRGRQSARVTVAVTRMLSALSTLPVYFDAETRGVPQIVATVWIFISVLITVLMLRTPQPATTG
jgi:hypothetical protein